MSFQASDIKVRIIAWFKINDLRAANSNIKCSGGVKEKEDDKVRPFVCYEVDGDLCFWTPLTNEPKFDKKGKQIRVHLKKDWIQGNLLLLFPNETDEAYLNHGNHLYQGAIHVFVELSKNSDNVNNEEYRPTINDVGFEEIIEKIKNQAIYGYRTREIDDSYNKLIRNKRK
jgi:hypothetical protein